MSLSTISFMLISVFLIFLGLRLFRNYRQSNDLSKLYMSVFMTFWGLTSFIVLFTIRFHWFSFYYENMGVMLFANQLSTVTLLVSNIALILFLKNMVGMDNNWFRMLFSLLIIGFIIDLFAPLTFGEEAGFATEISIPAEYGIPIFVIFFLLYFVMALLFFLFGRKLEGRKKIRSYLFGLCFLCMSISIPLETSELFHPLVIFYRILYYVSVALIILVFFFV